MTQTTEWDKGFLALMGLVDFFTISEPPEFGDPDFLTKRESTRVLADNKEDFNIVFQREFIKALNDGPELREDVFSKIQLEQMNGILSDIQNDMAYNSRTNDSNYKRLISYIDYLNNRKLKQPKKVKEYTSNSIKELFKNPRHYDEWIKWLQHGVWKGINPFIRDDLSFSGPINYMRLPVTWLNKMIELGYIKRGVLSGPNRTKLVNAAFAGLNSSPDRSEVYNKGKDFEIVIEEKSVRMLKLEEERIAGRSVRENV